MPWAQARRDAGDAVGGLPQQGVGDPPMPFQIQLEPALVVALLVLVWVGVDPPTRRKRPGSEGRQ